MKVCGSRAHSIRYIGHDASDRSSLYQESGFGSADAVGGAQGGILWRSRSQGRQWWIIWQSCNCTIRCLCINLLQSSCVLYYQLRLGRGTMNEALKFHSGCRYGTCAIDYRQQVLALIAYSRNNTIQRCCTLCWLHPNKQIQKRAPFSWELGGSSPTSFPSSRNLRWCHKEESLC